MDHERDRREPEHEPEQLVREQRVLVGGGDRHALQRRLEQRDDRVGRARQQRQRQHHEISPRIVRASGRVGACAIGRSVAVIGYPGRGRCA
jgi:hypothetical protein